MDRRGFLLGATALLAAGCAQVRPSDVTAAPRSPSPAAVPLAVGQDGTQCGALLAQLLVQAMAAKGRTASVVAVADDWQAALGDGSLSFLPAYAGTLWAGLSDEDEPPAAEDLVGDVADLLAPDVSALAAPKVDGSLVWMVSQRTAEAGITSLERLGPWSKGRTAAVPHLALSRGDGVPGLQAVYGATFSVAEVADPKERATRLASGAAGIAAFRRTDYTGVSGLVALDDPDKLGTPDPLIVLLGSALADGEPDSVLAVDAVAKALTTDVLLQLQGKVAAGPQYPAVAKEWLVSQGLA